MSQSRSWFQDEDFWRISYPFMFHAESWEAAAGQIEKIRGLLHVDPPARMLDLCCGPGRFVIPFATQGFRVTAVDRNRFYLDDLRTRAANVALDIEIVESDMRDFCRPNAFDAAVNLYTSFGYFEDPEDDRTVLRNLYTSLKPGGRLLMEMGSREGLIRNFQKRDWIEHDGQLLVEERTFSDDYTRLHNRWIVITESDRYEWQFDLRLYGPGNLPPLLRDVGFSDIATMGSFDGTPYDLKTTRLIVLATK